MKKFIAGVCAVIAVIFIFNQTSTKSKLPGTWYYVSDPDEYITIYKNGRVEMSDDGTYTYSYKNGTISFIPDNPWFYDTMTAKVKIKGDTMYLDYGSYTEQLCNSHEKSYEEYSRQHPEEYEEDIQQEIEAEENFQEYVMLESRPQPGVVQNTVENMGYDVFEYTGREEYIGELYEVEYPTIIYSFDCSGVVDRISVYYEYIGAEWKLSYVYEHINGEWEIAHAF